jgi:hypothetical protein
MGSCCLLGPEVPPYSVVLWCFAETGHGETEGFTHVLTSGRAAPVGSTASLRPAALFFVAVVVHLVH